MRYVEAPAEWSLGSGEVSVFLAGGITGCEDWQAKMRSWFAHGAPEVVLLNPRRAGFDVNNGDSAAQQVAWEHDALWRADVTVFWFPACDPSVTVQPIALYELGAAAASDPSERTIVVGADPGYPRRADVELQLGHERPELCVLSSMVDIYHAVEDAVSLKR